jgi:hypothetical protein
MTLEICIKQKLLYDDIYPKYVCVMIYYAYFCLAQRRSVECQETGTVSWLCNDVCIVSSSVNGQKKRMLCSQVLVIQ